MSLCKNVVNYYAAKLDKQHFTMLQLFWYFQDKTVIINCDISEIHHTTIRYEKYYFLPNNNDIILLIHRIFLLTFIKYDFYGKKYATDIVNNFGRNADWQQMCHRES